MEKQEEVAVLTANLEKWLEGLKFKCGDDICHLYQKGFGNWYLEGHDEKLFNLFTCYSEITGHQGYVIQDCINAVQANCLAFNNGIAFMTCDYNYAIWVICSIINEMCLQFECDEMEVEDFYNKSTVK